MLKTLDEHENMFCFPLILWATCCLLLLGGDAQPKERICWFSKKTRTGEECEGPLRKFNEAIARLVGSNLNCWACSRHWMRATREATEHCSCPLSEHSNELSPRYVPKRLYDLFDRLGGHFPNYRPETRWCNKCAAIADNVFAGEKDYIPPAKVSIIFPLVYISSHLKKIREFFL